MLGGLTDTPCYSEELHDEVMHLFTVYDHRVEQLNIRLRMGLRKEVKDAPEPVRVFVRQDLTVPGEILFGGDQPAHLVHLLQGRIGLVRVHVFETVKDIYFEKVEEVCEGDAVGAAVVIQALLRLLDAQTGGHIVGQHLQKGRNMGTYYNL